MTNNTTQTNNRLETLFDQARSYQPELRDDNFTKVVMNTIGADAFVYDNIAKAEKWFSKRALSVDGIALVFGATATYLFADLSQILASFINMIPETVTIDPLSIAAYAGGITLAGITAWWALENSNI